MQWDNTITAIFNWLGSLSWPIAVLIIICIFKKPILEFLAHLETIRWGDLVLKRGDKFRGYSPTEKKFLDVIFQPPTPAVKAKVAEIPKLSEEEIEQSRQRAQKRLDEDTKRVGYQRGKLFKTDSGKWAIAWEP